MRSPPVAATPPTSRPPRTPRRTAVIATVAALLSGTVASEDPVRDSSHVTLTQVGRDASGRTFLSDETGSDEPPFRLTVGEPHAKAVPKPVGATLVRVPLELGVGPHRRPLFAQFAAEDFRLTGSDAHRLEAFTPAAKYELPFGAGVSKVETALDFLDRDGRAAKPYRLTGSFRLTLAAEEQAFRRPFAAGKSAADDADSRGGVSVRYSVLEKRPDGTASVALTVDYAGGGPAFESHRAWVYHDVAYLTYEMPRTELRRPSDRIRLDHLPGAEIRSEPNGRVAAAYEFAGLPPDTLGVEFHYVAPTRIVETTVEFTAEGLAAIRRRPRPPPRGSTRFPKAIEPSEIAD